MPACIEPQTVTSASERWALQLTDCFASRATPRTAARAERGAARAAAGAARVGPSVSRDIWACMAVALGVQQCLAQAERGVRRYVG